MEIDYNNWIGKRIYLILKSGRKYTGYVKSFDKQNLLIIDKFEEFVIVATDEISSMEVEK